MRRAVLWLLLASCGDNAKPAVAGDAGIDAVSELKPCLDRPTDLARPPTGQLSCDLLPPDFK